MPGEGFFYTYLTNFSDNLVTFDNLTIRHKQGTLRNIHEYYPYGLEYWRSGTKLYDRGDQFSEFHHREWELDGIEMNRFAARWYDPVIARWHAPDPLEQMHSPYVALCGDPANFVDPDGRAGIHLSDWTKDCIKDAFLMYGGAAVGGAAVVGIGKVLQGVEFVGSTLQGILNVVSSVKSFFTVVKNLFSGSNGIGGIDNVSIGKSEAVGGEMNNHGNNGAKLGTQGITSTSSNVLTNSAEIEWSRITRSGGSFMGNLIWMDGATGLQNGNNVEVFLYYCMHKLQSDHNREILGYLIQDGNGNLGYFIGGWRANTEGQAYDIPEVTLRAPNG